MIAIQTRLGGQPKAGDDPEPTFARSRDQRVSPNKVTMVNAAARLGALSQFEVGTADAKPVRAAMAFRFFFGAGTTNPPTYMAGSP